MKHIFTISLCFLALSLSAQVDCPNTFDNNSDGAVTINDLLDLLAVFGDTDTDSDGIWDSIDDCIDLTACNYANDPTEACNYIDVLGNCGGGCEGDSDNDGICDSEDDCVGVLDECGVCNGPGPTEVVIESITILYDSVYAEAIDNWFVFEIGADTVFNFTCAPVSISGCTLFVSEIAEGSSNNKYIELFNPTSSTVFLDQYTMANCSNGCDTPTAVYLTDQFDYWTLTFPAGATVAPESTYVIAHPSADPIILAVADMTYTYLSNGDDTYALAEIVGADTVLVDLIGDIGPDPGSGFTVSGILNATQNGTLVRKSDVNAGNAGMWLASAGTNEFDGEWIVNLIDDWSNLDSHVFASVCDEAPEFVTCGAPISHDGYDYSTVLIGEQCWFSENCRYLPVVSPSSEGSGSDPYYYVYDYQGSDVTAAQATTNYATYGVLYNWPAVMTEGICPSGWHIPSDGEFTELTDFLGGESVAGYVMKSTSGWDSGGNGSNSSGFTGLPGGYRYSGGFLNNGFHGYWWSASEYGSGYYSWERLLNTYNVTVSRGYYERYYGFSARCVRD